MIKDTTRLDKLTIAAWLRKEAAQARRAAVAAAEPYGQRLSLEAADKLDRAAEIVERSVESTPTGGRTAANDEARVA